MAKEAEDLRDSPEETAASVVFDTLVDREIASAGYNATSGVLSIHDIDRLGAILGIAVAELPTDPRSFVEADVLVVPWPITRWIAQRAAKQHPDEILAWIGRDEAEARRDAIRGRSSRSRGRDEWYLAPDDSAQLDDEHGRPIRKVLREWLGVEWDRQRELDELRREAARATGIARDAIAALRKAGATRDAIKLERDLNGTD